MNKTWCVMKRRVLVCLLIIGSVFLMSTSVFTQERSGNQQSKSGSNVYQCPKDLGVISNNPGKCNKCSTQLEAVTMDQAMDNLSSGEMKKPDLQSKSIGPYKKRHTRVEETPELHATEAVDNSHKDEPVAKAGHSHEKDHISNVLKIDLNRDGLIYQCPKCFNQMADEPDDCETCYSDMVMLSVEKASNNVPVCDH